MNIGHPLVTCRTKTMKCLLQAKTDDDDDDEEEKVENPYADPNYPDVRITFSLVYVIKTDRLFCY